MNKFAPKRKDKLISTNSILNPLIKIDESDGYYISSDGKVYRRYSDTELYPLLGYTSKTNGYNYATIQVNGKHKSFRVNRLVANAFMPNPNNLPIVGHQNNIKTDNRVANLYWTTSQENTQKAVDDGLLVNDKGYDDSQSIQVVCLDKNGNFIKEYGSISIAHKELGVSKSTIKRQIEHQHNSMRCGYYFRSKEEYDKYGFVL